MRSLLCRSFALLLLLVPVAAACGGSDGGDEESTGSTTTTTIPTLEADDVDAEASPFCATWAEIRGVGGAKVTNDAEKDKPIIKEHYAKLLPLAEKLADQADDEIKETVDATVEQVEHAAETGEVVPNEEQQQELAAYTQEHCAKG